MRTKGETKMQSEYARQREAFDRAWQDAIKGAYQRMMRGDENAFYLYYIPQGERFATFSDMDTIPQGFELVTGERISGFKTLEQLYAWARPLVGCVPYFRPVRVACNNTLPIAIGRGDTK